MHHRRCARRAQHRAVQRRAQHARRCHRGCSGRWKEPVPRRHVTRHLSLRGHTTTHVTALARAAEPTRVIRSDAAAVAPKGEDPERLHRTLIRRRLITAICLLWNKFSPCHTRRRMRAACSPSSSSDQRAPSHRAEASLDAERGRRIKDRRAPRHSQSLPKSYSTRLAWATVYIHILQLTRNRGATLSSTPTQRYT